MKNVAELVLHHQEKYDGTGYPDGLKGDEIPLGCRILSVVDAYHAMTSDRVYRKALTLEVARNEILQNKGKQFDPDVVDHFMNILSMETSVM
jgi:HD-GYP domain-containing protein (c-di-GMP phosphodiesterase class II)